MMCRPGVCVWVGSAAGLLARVHMCFVLCVSLVNKSSLLHTLRGSVGCLGRGGASGSGPSCQTAAAALLVTPAGHRQGTNNAPKSACRHQGSSSASTSVWSSPHAMSSTRSPSSAKNCTSHGSEMLAKSSSPSRPWSPPPHVNSRPSSVTAAEWMRPAARRATPTPALAGTSVGAVTQSSAAAAVPPAPASAPAAAASAAAPRGRRPSPSCPSPSHPHAQMPPPAAGAAARRVCAKPAAMAVMGGRPASRRPVRVAPPRVDPPRRVQADRVVHPRRDAHPPATRSARRRGYGGRHAPGGRGRRRPPQLPVPVVAPRAQPAGGVDGGGVAPARRDRRPRRARRRQ